MNDDFEKNFMEKVNLETRAEQLAVEETKAAVAETTPIPKPVIKATIASTPETTSEPKANGTTKKTLLISVIVAAICVLALVVIILALS